jgi:hypothetical protein
MSILQIVGLIGLLIGVYFLVVSLWAMKAQASPTGNPVPQTLTALVRLAVISAGAFTLSGGLSRLF